MDATSVMTLRDSGAKVEDPGSTEERKPSPEASVSAPGKALPRVNWARQDHLLATISQLENKVRALDQMLKSISLGISEKVAPDPDEKVKPVPTNAIKKLEVEKWIQDNEFWSQRDGSVTLIVEGVAFRVRREILVAASPLFKDLSLLAKLPPTTSDSEDGAQTRISVHPNMDATWTVSLPGDSSRDWRYVLRKLMLSSRPPSNKPTLKPRTLGTYQEVFAYVRLGCRYQMKGLYEEAMGYLKSYFTTSFSVWSQLQSDGAPTGFVYTQRAIGVVNIARLTGELSLLPLSMLTCCQLFVSLLLGFSYSDGKSEMIELDDLLTCVKAKPRLEKATLANFVRMASVLPSASCSHATNLRGVEGGVCRNTARSFAERIQSNLETSCQWTLSNPLTNIYALYTKDDIASLCAGCQKALVEEQEKIIKETWNSLPSLLGITVPEWEVVPV